MHRQRHPQPIRFYPLPLGSEDGDAHSEAKTDLYFGAALSVASGSAGSKAAAAAAEVGRVSCIRSPDGVGGSHPLLKKISLGGA